MIAFDKPLPIGTGVTMRGQRFVLVAIEPHTKRDGSQSSLSVWESDCADCGKVFQTRSPRLKLADGRRCYLHKKPGVKSPITAGRG